MAATTAHLPQEALRSATAVLGINRASMALNKLVGSLLKCGRSALWVLLGPRGSSLIKTLRWVQIPSGISHWKEPVC